MRVFLFLIGFCGCSAGASHVGDLGEAPAVVTSLGAVQRLNTGVRPRERLEEPIAYEDIPVVEDANVGDAGRPPLNLQCALPEPQYKGGFASLEPVLGLESPRDADPHRSAGRVWRYVGSQAAPPRCARRRDSRSTAEHDSIPRHFRPVSSLGRMIPTQENVE